MPIRDGGRRGQFLLVLLLAPVLSAPFRAGRVLDDFRDVTVWRAHASPGATFSLQYEAGAMRVDWTVQHGRAWAVVRRELPFAFPDDYTLSYLVRGPARARVLVRVHGAPEWTSWTASTPDSVLPFVWDTVHFESRHIVPDGAGLARPDSVTFVDFVILPAEAGTGTLWLDDLMLEERATPEPDSGGVRASTSESPHAAERAMDGDTLTSWRSVGDLTHWFAIDLPEKRRIGGLVLDWAEDHAAHYEVMLSPDGMRWTSWFQALDADGGRDWIPLPHAEARHIRIDMIRSARGAGYALREVEILSHEDVPTRAAFHARVARSSVMGLMPRGTLRLIGSAPWVPLGLPEDTREVLLSEDAAIELPAGNALLEPFLRTDTGLRTWGTVNSQVRLVEGDLPLASLRWQHADSLELETTAFVAGDSAGTLLVRYRVENRGAARRNTTLFVAIRPYTVAPRGEDGNVGRIDEVSWDGYAVTVDGTQRIVPLVPPGAFGARSTAQGDVVESMVTGQLPAVPHVLDPNGFASAALAFELEVPVGGMRDVFLAVPFDSSSVVPQPGATMAEAADAFVQAMTSSGRRWRARLDAPSLRGPAQAEDVLRAFRSSIAWIDIAADGARLQPGARHDEAFLASGAFTASTLLRLGRHDAVRDFLDLFASARADGRIPCCIDARGPVFDDGAGAEGAFLGLAAEYYRHTGDRAFLERIWPAVEAAAITIERQLAPSRPSAGNDEPPVYADAVRETDTSVMRDTVVALMLSARGIAGAAQIAEILGHTAQRDRWSAVRDRRAAPALAEAPPPTDPHVAAVLVRLGGSRFDLGAEALRNVLESAWAEVAARLEGQARDTARAQGLRLVSAFARLTWKARANDALEELLDGRRPAPWNQWAGDDGAPADAAADYIAAVLDLFAFERADTLVIAAGVPDTWLAEGTSISLAGLSTSWGRMDLSLRAEGPRVHVSFGNALRVPPGGIEVHSPLGRPVSRATVDGRTVPVERNAVVRLATVPRELVLYY